MAKDNSFTKNILAENIVNEQELQFLLLKYQQNEFDILMHLVKLGIGNREKLGKLWGASIGFAYVDLKRIIFQPDIVNKLPKEFAIEHKVIPLYKFGRVVTVATFDPTSSFTLSNVEKLAHSQVSPVFAFPDEIDEAIEMHYAHKSSIQSVPQSTPPKASIKEPKPEPKLEPAFSEKTTKYFTENTKDILNDVFNGNLPKETTCNNLRDKIIEEVHTKLDAAYCINQLRINDEYTYSHSINVAILSSVIGKILGFSVPVLKELTLGALLHDVGKMRIPKNILYKSGKLNPQEMEIVKRHPQSGYQIIQMMKLPEKISEIALKHHERVDGNGYPGGLTSENLSLNVQIVSLIDVYDALVSDRPYKKAIQHSEAINILLLEGKSSFNFDLLYKFVTIIHKQNTESLKGMFKSIVYGEII